MAGTSLVRAIGSLRPMAADGKVFIASTTGVGVFGLLP